MTGRKPSSGAGRRAKKGGPWRIQIRDSQDALKVDKKRMRGLVRRVLASEKHASARISLAIVDDAEITRLNARYLGRRSSTDVLAFAYGAPEDPVVDEELGEVIVSAETAAREAGLRRKTPEKELDLYVVHGLLHLLGYDDASPGKARVMRHREKELLGMLGG